MDLLPLKHEKLNKQKQKKRQQWSEGVACLQPKYLKAIKGKSAGNTVMELFPTFTCQVPIVSQIASPVFSARLRLSKQTSKERGLHRNWVQKHIIPPTLIQVNLHATERKTCRLIRSVDVVSYTKSDSYHIELLWQRKMSQTPRLSEKCHQNRVACWRQSEWLECFCVSGVCARHLWVECTQHNICSPR